ncbi:MAG: hypothetical protein RL065_2026, partial [Bacteroidota bacterium]
MKKTFLIILFAFTSLVAKSQSSKSFDLSLIEKKDFINENSIQHRNAIHFKSKNAFLNYNPINLFFKGSLYFYQNVISK